MRTDYIFYLVVLLTKKEQESTCSKTFLIFENNRVHIYRESFAFESNFLKSLRFFTFLTTVLLGSASTSDTRVLPVMLLE